MNKNRGFIAFTTLLVISAVALAVSVSISLLGVGSAKSALDYKKGELTKQIAKSCLEESMLRLKKDGAYSGAIGLTLADGKCNITITGTGLDRTIDIESYLQGNSSYYKRLRAVVKVSGGGINIISYGEI